MLHLIFFSLDLICMYCCFVFWFSGCCVYWRKCSSYSVSWLFFRRILAKDELVAALEKCAEILKSANSKRMQNVLKQVEDFIGRLEALEGKSVCVVSVQAANVFYRKNLNITNYLHFHSVCSREQTALWEQKRVCKCSQSF